MAKKSSKLKSQPYTAEEYRRVKAAMRGMCNHGPGYQLFRPEDVARRARVGIKKTLAMGNALVAEGFMGMTVEQERLVQCQCECGTIAWIPESDLLSGKSRDCGCGLAARGQANV